MYLPEDRLYGLSRELRSDIDVRCGAMLSDKLLSQEGEKPIAERIPPTSRCGNIKTEFNPSHPVAAHSTEINARH